MFTKMETDYGFLLRRQRGLDVQKYKANFENCALKRIQCRFLLLLHLIKMLKVLKTTA